MFFIAVQLSPLVVEAALLYLMLSSLFGFALIASIHAWAVAKAGITRSRAGIFALAFGVRDICWGVIYANDIWQIIAGTYLVEQGPEGGISNKERSLLIRLRDSLGISPTDAETLERELQMGAVA